jgi:hypothetical protein
MSPLATLQRVPVRARALLAVILSLLALGGATSAGAGEPYPHLLLGNPSNAKDDPGDKDNYLVKKEFFALSYNNARGTPNWVSWRLTKDDLGDAPRSGRSTPTPPCRGASTASPTRTTPAAASTAATCARTATAPRTRR